MKKLRIDRIVEGISKAVIGLNTSFSDSRKQICDGCPKNKKSICDICGCFLKAKTKVFEEYCPMNKWKDIKILKVAGVGLAIKNPEKITLSINEKSKSFVLDYGQIKEKEVVVKVVIINDRGNFFSKDKDITHLQVVPGCSCTTLTEVKNHISEGDSSEFELEFRPKGLKPFSKKIYFTSNETSFNILLTGEVIE